MKVLIIGSGLIGLTSAYFLRQQGHAVTVIDRATAAGRETSFANGALLTPSMANPWNAPGVWSVLLRSIGRSDSAMQLRLPALFGSVRWGLSFLRNSSTAAFERNTLSNFQLALYSMQTLHALLQEHPLDYGRSTNGALRVFRDAAALERAYESARTSPARELHVEKLSREETVEREPALEPIADEMAGALFYADDEVGNAYSFCTALAEIARQQGVQFRFGVEVKRIETRAGSVTRVVAGAEELSADQYIVAAGSYSLQLLHQVGIQLPVRPVKGYSITYDRPSNISFKTPIIDDALHTVIVPLGEHIRVAGTAEFAGYDLQLSQPRIANLKTLVRAVLPQAELNHATARPWCGLRAVSVDGVPIVGFTQIDNLLVNTGHGHLGWTLAAGSGRLLAELIAGTTPGVEPKRYALERFSRPA